MTLVDAGPLIAIIDRDDDDHELCVEALSHLSSPLITTWPAFTEAIYILGHRVGWHGQEKLWRLVLRHDLHLAPPEPETIERIRNLMEKYRDLPMDLADASLVALAETRELRRIFTLDTDFRVYQINGKHPFEIVP
jgi:predicted nucleic acid-binding protein